MKKTPRPRLPYGKRGGQREPYRLWFEYLKLARASADPAVKRALADPPPTTSRGET